MSDPIDTTANTLTSRDPEPSSPPGWAPCPELVWENEGGQLRGPPDLDPATRMKEIS